MPIIRTVPAHAMTLELCARIFELLNLIWPSTSGEPTDVVSALEDWKSDPTTHFIIGDDVSGQVHAHALIFVREIFTDNGSLRVGALGNVCVHPAHRGRGWGAAVARAAFDYLPQMNVEVSLFQTPVPVFYRKLGCRLIDNLIFDGTREDRSRANPFSDKWQMIYPASFPWPQGEIDLNGPEY